MKAVLMLLLVVPLVGCRTQIGVKQNLVYAGGDGSSCQKAVVIQGVTLREAGLVGQRTWLEQRYPGFQKTKEKVINSNNKQFDQVELTANDGSTSSVYFDVTDWWSK